MLVISQKKYIHVRLAEKTRPNMAPRNTNSMERKKGERSRYSVWCLW